MRVTCYSSPADLAPLAEAWLRLAGGNPFRSPQWLLPWWQHYGAQRELCVVAVHDEGMLLGLAPWFVEPRAAAGRVLQFLGSGEVCSDYLGILADEAQQAAVITAIADWLDQPQNARCDLIHLSGICVGDETTSTLAAQLTKCGWTVHQQPGLNTWRIEFDSDWETYVESLSKSHRKQVRRVDRRLVESGEAVLQVASNAEQLEQGLAILIDLHQRRRLSLGEPGCFADTRFEGFLRATATELLAQDMLRLCWIELRGKPISVEFQLAGGGVTYAYQAGLDPEALDEEPGRIANIATLKHALTSGQRAFDFLRGDEPYKAHWRAQPHASAELRMVPPKMASQLRHGLWVAGDTVKRWIKTGLGKASAEAAT